jgi:hypothetical protein|tara:strand:+ start:245 stop:472 length:228 start_codon:yes stop_codon:yes gene_type:complete
MIAKVTVFVKMGEQDLQKAVISAESMPRLGEQVSVEGVTYKIDSICHVLGGGRCVTLGVSKLAKPRKPKSENTSP